jgi:death-on-curing family protein
MTKKIQKNKKELVIYQAKNGEIKFRGDFDGGTIWATQKQMAEIFDVDVRTVNEHIKNIFKTKELKKDSTIRNFRIVQKEGKREVVRNIEHYNLDMIISIGYRVNSKIATEFRIWATKTLKQHITKGYTINKKVLAQNYNDFMRAVDSVQKLLPKGEVISTENILELIKAFANTWFLLESYDEDEFPQKGFTKKKVKVTAKELYDAVASFKKQLIKKKQATELFAQEKKQKSLEGILGNVLQAVFKKEVYETVEEKAAHLLYFVVKNHPFSDGNKRSGAFSFIWFLQKFGINFRQKITPEALTVVTLLVAESKPTEKERIIGLILLLLKK